MVWRKSRNKEQKPQRKGWKKEEKDLIVKTISFDDEEIKNKGRIDLSVNDYSGVGAFVLSKKEEETVIYFAINYAPKKKIYYYIEKNNIVFKTKNSISSLKVRVLSDEDRLPCLKEEETCISKEFTVKFHNHKGVIPKEKNKKKIFVDFGGTEEEIEQNRKTYLLICEGDVAHPKQIKNRRVINSKVICPYCHNEIVFDASNYRKGMYCDGKEIKEFEVINKNNKKNKNFICCKQCITKNSYGVNARPFRMLPNKVEKNRNYRIAVLGKARSGKTTFISRLFNITGAENKVIVKPDDSEFFKFYNIRAYSPNLLERKKDISSKTLTYMIQNTPYYSGDAAEPTARDFFNRYSISLTDKKFISPTVRGESANTTKYPFIFEVNNGAYVNVYDIAGEDVENGSTVLNSITRGENVSLIIVVDLSKDISVNHNILLTAQKCYEKYKKTCPVAIVLSKFDQFEDEFNSNCACLNSDYRTLFAKNLNNSSLIHHINTASDEIESYLLKKDIRIRETYFKDFNLKFFSVSSITYSDAMYHVPNKDKSLEKNGLNFVCSQKRLELPVLWILHELGEI